MFNLMPTPPEVAFDSLPGACAPYTVTMTNNSLYGTSYVWEFGDGGVSYAENPTYTYLESGTYRITLTVTGPGGVRSTSKLIEVWHTPRAFFQVAPEFVYVDDEKVRCFNLSEGATSYIWEFGDGDTSMVADPFHKYMAEGIYDITLHAYSDNGCYDTYTLSPAVTVEPAGDIRFANVFRPNKDGELPGDVGSLNADQIDMVFFPPVKEQVSEYKLQIFNRAGVLIFQSNDINKGWNGYYKGRLVMQGVYVWYVEGKYANGKPFKKTGDITLLH
jgi:gliding motility-associated-like protein